MSSVVLQNFSFTPNKQKAIQTSTFYLRSIRKKFDTRHILKTYYSNSKKQGQAQQVFKQDSKDVVIASYNIRHYDFIVIGSGIAGLTYALKVAQHGSVAIITKTEAQEGNTRYAQGGISAVLDPLDSVKQHTQDTYAAGGYISDLRAVEVVCSEGPSRVLELAKLGTNFDVTPIGEFHLTREGGHSQRRVVHAKDVTGKEIEKTLLKAAKNSSNIQFFEHHQAVDFVCDEANGVKYCLGVDVIDQKAQQIFRFLGLSTMLCTGGAGHVYPTTTNPMVATGDGMAMAYRAQVPISNMEFIQFHPTGLWQSGSSAGRNPLISEAVRGEGGVLRNMQGDRFMEQYDQRCELAPRDVVARGIYDQMQKRGDSHVLLDITHKGRDFIRFHFPNIYNICMEKGIDMAKDPIPVSPIQHFMCGGVQTGLIAETSLPGLFACGEVAHSGLHGANRLASNSLLEGLVFAHRAVENSVAHAEHVQRDCQRQFNYASRHQEFKSIRNISAEAQDTIKGLKLQLNEIMWNSCGIVRNINSLQEASKQQGLLQSEVQTLKKLYGIQSDLVEIENLITVGQLITWSAVSRRESRGGHFLKDVPYSLESFKRPTVIGQNKMIDQQGSQNRSMPLQQKRHAFK